MRLLSVTWGIEALLLGAQDRHDAWAREGEQHHSLVVFAACTVCGHCNGGRGESTAREGQWGVCMWRLGEGRPDLDQMDG